MASTILRTTAAALKSSGTCASFAPKTVPLRAEPGRTPTGDANKGLGLNVPGKLLSLADEVVE